MRRWVLGISLFIFLLAANAGWWLYGEIHTPYYGARKDESFVTIPRGARPNNIADLLVKAGVLHYRYPFILYTRWTGAARRLQAGEYRFASLATPKQVADRLVRGDVYYVAITIPEGLTARETIAHISKHGLGDPVRMENALFNIGLIGNLGPAATDLEGYLFPETYHFPRKISSEEIVRSMAHQFQRRFSRLMETHPIPDGWTAFEIVTLASMIEKEARTEGERPLVASVLVNRLKGKMPLACDPTVIYALKLAGNYSGNLRKADLSMDDPYNTYVNPGLPPGPIANPGENALRAALSPANTDYFYYVSKNDGTHHFSKDFRSHLNAVARYQKKRAARSP